MRRAFELLYHQFAWAYDWVAAAFFRGEWRAWQRAVLPRTRAAPGSTVLELGAGTGDLQIDLRSAGLHAYGVDLSPAMLRRARRKARRQGAPIPRLARARAQALPFPAAAFAAVVSTFPNEYIFDPVTLAEIRRVLRPGGRLVVVPSAALLPVDRAARLLDRFAGIVYGRPRPRTRTVAARRGEIVAAFRREPAFGPLVPNLEAAGFAVRVDTAERAVSVAVCVVAVKPPGATRESGSPGSAARPDEDRE